MTSIPSSRSSLLPPRREPDLFVVDIQRSPPALAPMQRKARLDSDLPIPPLFFFASKTPKKHQNETFGLVAVSPPFGAPNGQKLLRRRNSLSAAMFRSKIL